MKGDEVKDALLRAGRANLAQQDMCRKIGEAMVAMYPARFYSVTKLYGTYLQAVAVLDGRKAEVAEPGVLDKAEKDVNTALEAFYEEVRQAITGLTLQ